MKKIYLLFVALVFAITSFAQIQHKTIGPEVSDNFDFKQLKELKMTPKSDVLDKMSPVFNRREMGDDIYFYRFAESYAQYMDDNGHEARFYYAQTFPEMMHIQYEDNDNPGTFRVDTVRYQSFGASFTPTGNYFELNGEPVLERHQNYRVDTIQLWYWYERRINNPSIVDTLLINVYNRNRVYDFSIGETPAFATVVYDRNNVTGVGPQVTIKEPLTIEDTLNIPWSRGPRSLNIPLQNFLVDSNTMAVTFTFKPGYSYSSADTLNGEFDKTQLSTQFNQFYFYYMSDMDYHDQEAWEGYNSGIFAFKFSNVPKDQNYWNYEYQAGQYIPFYIPHSFFSDHRFPLVRFMVSWDPDWVDPLSVETVNNTLAVNDIYPNPVVDIAKLDIELTTAQNVKVEVLNTLGQKMFDVVNTGFGLGKHTIDINTISLDAGYYICRISANGSTISKTMLVK